MKKTNMFLKMFKKSLPVVFVMRLSSSMESALYRSGESLHAAHAYTAPSINSTQGLSGIGLLMQQVGSEKKYLFPLIY